jgi:hypothetical protein
MASVISQQLLFKMYTSLLGNAAANSIFAENGRINLKKYNKYRRRLRTLHKEFSLQKAHLENLHSSCIQHIRPITSPLVLISQIQRSGGSLLSQLFDGHPELDAHPHELKIGFPRKYTWPTIDLNENPIRWLEAFFEISILEHIKSGYKKQKNLDETFSFLFLPSVQKSIFLSYLNSKNSIELRDVFDAYMTSYFGAWLNNQNIAGDKKFVTGFTARLAMFESNMESFFKIYPDGRLISIVRNPRNWYPSASRHRPEVYKDINTSLKLWKTSVLAMLRNKEKYGDQVCLLTFEDLIGKTDTVMHYLSGFLDIEFDEILVTPTFNKFPIKANTSFKAQQHGIIKKTLDRYKTLSQEDMDTIDRLTSDIYRSVLDIVVKF